MRSVLRLIPFLWRRQRRLNSALLPVLMVAVATGLLFTMALMAHEMEELRASKTNLEAQKIYEQEESWRREVLWYQATRREDILARAEAELHLLPSIDDSKELVAIAGPREDPEKSGFLEQLTRGLHRYGIQGAVAGEKD